MELLIDIASWLCLISGAFFVITGSIGLLRFPDFYTRLHAASLPDTLGTLLILGGLVLQGGWSQTTLKLILIVAFMFLTGPTSTHALAKAARHANIKPKLTTQQSGTEK